MGSLLPPMSLNAPTGSALIVVQDWVQQLSQKCGATIVGYISNTHMCMVPLRESVWIVAWSSKNQLNRELETEVRLKLLEIAHK